MGAIYTRYASLENKTGLITGIGARTSRWSLKQSRSWCCFWGEMTRR
jgi:hypothetical protein